MSDSTATSQPQLSIGEHVLERDLRVEITHPDEPPRYLAVLVEIIDGQTLTTDHGFAGRTAADDHLPDPAPLGVVARWLELGDHGLLDRLDDPPALTRGVKRREIPVTVVPLSELRSVEPALIAAEQIGMVYNEALKPLLDPETPPTVVDDETSVIDGRDVEREARFKPVSACSER